MIDKLGVIVNKDNVDLDSFESRIADVFEKMGWEFDSPVFIEMPKGGGDDA